MKIRARLARRSVHGQERGALVLPTSSRDKKNRTTEKTLVERSLERTGGMLLLANPKRLHGPNEL